MDFGNSISLFTLSGERKYLTQHERTGFEKTARKKDDLTKCFCLVLLWTGARISEALNLKRSNIDLQNKVIIIESLKKRRRGHFRQLPVPEQLLNELNELFDLASANPGGNNQPLWSWSRRTASRRIKSVMTESNIYGSQASAKGIRHSFAVHSVICGVPVMQIKRWMGHSYLQTTEIYLSVVGKEERMIAKRIWN